MKRNALTNSYCKYLKNYVFNLPFNSSKYLDYFQLYLRVFLTSKFAERTLKKNRINFKKINTPILIVYFVF